MCGGGGRGIIEGTEYLSTQSTQILQDGVHNEIGNYLFLVVSNMQYSESDGVSVLHSVNRYLKLINCLLGKLSI